ncbi:unnamed protein product [Porites evermanni]|uniref:Uncharacterized protein n=1 Tax=Porites evermanni TaxID=104178 RepID=A0ABN8MKV3_9CNID|nr:unnamed protein product [Porites evermanni]
MACNSNGNNNFFEKDIISSQNNQLLDGGLRVSKFPSGVLKVVERKRGQALMLWKAVDDYVHGIIRDSRRKKYKIQTLSCEEEGKDDVSTQFKSVITEKKNSGVGKKRGSIAPLTTERPFKGKQPRKNSLLHLDEISKLVDEKNATEFKDFIFFPGLQDVNGNDIVIINTSKLPKKSQFSTKKCFKGANIRGRVRTAEWGRE